MPKRRYGCLCEAFRDRQIDARTYPGSTCSGTDYIKTILDSLKVTGTKVDLCPGSFMSTGAFSPVAPMESAPMENSVFQTLISVPRDGK